MPFVKNVSGCVSMVPYLRNKKIYAESMKIIMGVACKIAQPTQPNLVGNGRIGCAI